MASKPEVGDDKTYIMSDLANNVLLQMENPLPQSSMWTLQRGYKVRCREVSVVGAAATTG